MKYNIKKINPVMGIKKVKTDEKIKNDAIDRIVDNICEIGDRTKKHPIVNMEIKKRKGMKYDYD